MSDDEKEKKDKPEKAEKVAKKASGTASLAAATRALILKATGQKPVEPSFSTMAHVASGSSVINLLIGGSAAKDGKGLTCPGYPRRRITEIYGAESSGKTTTALAAIAQCQKAGGLAMFLDFEHALHHGYAQTIGVSFDEDKLLYYAPDTLEDGMKMLYLGIRSGIDLAVVDSIAAMVPKTELEKKLDDPAKLGALASALSRNLPKLIIWAAKYPDPKEGKGQGTAVILLNQTRALIQTGGYGGGGDTDNSAGGKALKFYTYVRLKLTRVRSDYIEKPDPMTGKKKRIPIGNLVQVKVAKNKCDSKQGATGEVFIRYGFGLDDYHSLIEAGVARRIIKKVGAYFDYGDQHVQGRDKFRLMLIGNQPLLTSLRKAVTESILSASTIVEEDEIDEESILADVRAEIGDDQDDVDGVDETSLESIVDEAEAS